MEFHVFHLDRLSPRRPTRRFEHDLVVEPEPELRHPAQVAFEFDGAQDFGAQDVARGRDEEVEGLDDVEEDFVFAVSDPLAAP